MAPSDSTTQFLSMRDAIDLLVQFGDSYSMATTSADDPEGHLVAVTQTLLALLTDRAATPEDVEDVLPCTTVLSDA